MAKWVTGGIISAKPKNYEYLVDHYSNDDDDDRVIIKPTGVFITASNKHPRVVMPEMHYAGVNTPQQGFQLPNDPKFLRDIAKCLVILATNLEESPIPD